MQMAQRAIRRLAFIGWLGLFGMTGLPAHLAQAAAPPERILPDTTLFLLKLNDVKSFREAFRGSQYGQLWNDPASRISGKSWRCGSKMRPRRSRSGSASASKSCSSSRRGTVARRDRSRRSQPSRGRRADRRRG